MICELCKSKEETPGCEPWCQQCDEINTWVRHNPAVARKVLRRISKEDPRG